MKFGPSKEWGVPILLFIATILAYGLLLPRLDFIGMIGPSSGLQSSSDLQSLFPPLRTSAHFWRPIFYVTTSLIPPEPIYWQIFMLLIRFASGLLAWSIFSQVWPRHKRSALVASFLFLLFPGYSQHWVAFTHINQEWIAFPLLSAFLWIYSPGAQEPGQI